MQRGRVEGKKGFHSAKLSWVLEHGTHERKGEGNIYLVALFLSMALEVYNKHTVACWGSII